MIDDVDVSSLPLSFLRSKMTIIPQTPFLFQGTLRENFDPFGQFSDLELWECVRLCSVSDLVEKNGGLDQIVEEGGSSFSVGEKQLICIVRALLQKNKILCLDECTANVDLEFSEKVQNIIRNSLEGVTVLTIAHRVETLMAMERMLVMDKGKVVADGDPLTLISRKIFDASGSS